MEQSPLLLSLAFSAAALLAGPWLAAGSVVQAAPLGQDDLDLDGMVDLQEAILGTDPYQGDSDGDGYGDLEEFARGSDPQVFLEAPGAAEPSLAMTGRVKGDTFFVVTALFTPGGNLHGADLRFGLQVNGVAVPLSNSIMYTNSTLAVVPGRTAGDLVYILETPIPAALVHSFGTPGLYATFKAPGMTGVTQAAALNLASINGVICQVTGGVSTSTGSSASMYRPLADDPAIPMTWTPGQVCVQSLSTIGVVGSILQQQVDSAHCEPLEADSYCPPQCANLTGTLIEVVDPLALIGG